MAWQNRHKNAVSHSFNLTGNGGNTLWPFAFRKVIAIPCASLNLWSCQGYFLGNASLRGPSYLLVIQSCIASQVQYKEKQNRYFSIVNLYTITKSTGALTRAFSRYNLRRVRIYAVS
jgi:hypothetical protein